MNKDIDRVVKDLEETKKYFKSSTYKSMIGRDIVKAIYSRTKSGIGVASDSKLPENTIETKLLPLDPKTIKARQKHRGTRGELFSPKRSNLTMTGLLLKSITFSLTAVGVKISIQNKNYKTGETTQNVAEYVRKARPFFALSSKQFNVLIERLNRDFRDKFRRLLK